MKDYTIWIQGILVLGGILASWVNLSTTISELDINQKYLRKDLDEMQASFKDLNKDTHLELKDLDNHVESIERAMARIYNNNNRRTNK